MGGERGNERGRLAPNLKTKLRPCTVGNMHQSFVKVGDYLIYCNAVMHATQLSWPNKLQ